MMLTNEPKLCLCAYTVRIIVLINKDMFWLCAYTIRNPNFVNLCTTVGLWNDLLGGLTPIKLYKTIWYSFFLFFYFYFLNHVETRFRRTRSTCSFFWIFRGVKLYHLKLVKNNLDYKIRTWVFSSNFRVLEKCGR